MLDYLSYDNSTGATNQPYLNNNVLYLCNNSNFIYGYSDYNYQFGGTVSYESGAFTDSSHPCN